MPRPRFEPEARHAPLDAALYEDFEFATPDDLARLSYGNTVSSRDVGQHEHDVLDLDADPVPGAHHVGRTYSVDEWRERQATPAYMRAPEGPRGPGDEGAHRRVELAYRAAFHRRFGLQPTVTPRAHVAIKVLIDNLGLDRTLDVIREAIDEAPRWRKVPITVQDLAKRWVMWREG